MTVGLAVQREQLAVEDLRHATKAFQLVQRPAQLVPTRKNAAHHFQVADSKRPVPLIPNR